MFSGLRSATPALAIKNIYFLDLREPHVPQSFSLKEAAVQANVLANLSAILSQYISINNTAPHQYSLVLQVCGQYAVVRLCAAFSTRCGTRIYLKLTSCHRKTRMNIGRRDLKDLLEPVALQ